MNWELRHDIWYSGEYRLYCDSRGEWTVWLYAHNHNGCIKRGIQLLTRAKAFAEVDQAQRSMRDAMAVTE